MLIKTKTKNWHMRRTDCTPSLTSFNEVKKFELKLIKLSDKYLKYLPSFEEYFRKTAEKIRSGVLQLRIENKWLPINWKNNSCESMNHIIKLSANWKTMKLPDLIERLVKLQQAECRRALYGQGNYELAPWMSKCKIQYVHWTQKTKEEKEALFAKFMNLFIHVLSDLKQEHTALPYNK